MTEVWMDIRHKEAASRPLFRGDQGLREALQNYVRLRWPASTAKFAAKEWDLTIDEGKGLVSGRTSITTLDKILHHKRGGWRVGLQILAAVIGSAVQAFFIAEKERLADEAEHARRAADAAALADHNAARALGREASLAWTALAGRPAPLGGGSRSFLGGPGAQDLGGGEAEPVATSPRGRGA